MPDPGERHHQRRRPASHEIAIAREPIGVVERGPYGARLAEPDAGEVDRGLDRAREGAIERLEGARRILLLEEQILGARLRAAAREHEHDR